MLGAGPNVATCDDPLLLEPDTEGDIGDETANSDTWDVADQGEKDGLVVVKQTRTYATWHEYEDSWFHIIGVYRTFKYDSTWRLVEVSGETHKTISSFYDPNAVPSDPP